MDSLKWRYFLAVFIGACSYGVLSTVVKLSYEKGLKIAEVTVAQFFTGWLILALIFCFTPNKRALTIRKKILLMVGGIPSGLVGIFYYTSLETVDASFAIILLFQFVWMGILLDSAVNKKIPDKKMSAAILTLLLGTFLSSGLNGSEPLLDLKGILSGLLAAAAFALFIFANARIVPDLHAVQRSFYMVSGSFLIVALIFVPVLFRNGIGSVSDLGIYGMVLGFFGVFIPPFLFAYGMPLIGSSIGSILGSAELPVTIILSMLFLHEYVTWLQWSGILLILTAIILSNLNIQSVKEKYMLRKD
jgi:drug/metabolite transporter (DMT)-like permease